MTAINALVRQDRVHVMTDGAVYRADYGNGSNARGRLAPGDGASKQTHATASARCPQDPKSSR